MKKMISKLSVLALGLTLGVGVISLTYKNFINEVSATGDYSQSVSDYYQGINWNKTGADLKTDLYNKIKITTAGWSYDGLWEAYKKTDVRPDGTHFWDIYSDTTMYTLDDSRINASYKKEGVSINREHIIPQSSFNEAAPMKSDVHHVLPSDGYVNNRRSAYPHGEVTGSATYTSNDGCKLGSGGDSLGTVFEPMDQYKGDIARIYFYFVTCYENKMSSNTFSAFNKTTYPSIDSKYLPTYLKWAKEDPVSEKEIIRNNEAYKGQGNRNPFIDCPYAVGAIWDSTHASDYGVKGQYTSGDGISINKTSVNLISGGTTQISASATDSSTITWTTSSSSVVSLSSSSSSSGSSITLTAGNEGDATITAKATISGDLYQTTCSVHVDATKKVTSISVSGQKTSFEIDEDFHFGGVVTASFNDDTNENVTSSATFDGYDMSVAGQQTVTVSYTYQGDQVQTTYQINVSTSGGSESIDDYTVGTSPLTSSGIISGMKVAFGTSPTNLATSIDSNWIYLSSTSSDWLVFTLEGTSSGFTLKHEDQYIYCSTAKKVSWGDSGTTLTLIANNLVSAGESGIFYLNGTGLRPYASGAYTDAYLYPLVMNKTLSDIDIATSPTKLTYEEGEHFDPTGLVIQKIYSDTSTDNYTYAGHTSEFTFVPSLLTELTCDDDVIEIIYGGYSVFQPIEVERGEVLEYIELVSPKTNFVEGDTYSFNGTVIAHYESGSESDVTSSTSFTGYDMTLLGNQTVTVTYQGESETYNINVTKGTLLSISLSGQTTQYVKNGAFSFDGVVSAHFENGYEKSVEPTSVSSPDLTTTGNKNVTVSVTYNGVTKSQTYQITVLSYRHVYEEDETLLGTITYTTGEEVISSTGISTSSSGGYSQIDTEFHVLRLGKSDGTGTLTVNASNMTKIVVRAKAYKSDTDVTMRIASTNYTITSSYVDYEYVSNQNVNSISISSVANKKRILVEQITIYSVAMTDIGQTEDCVGLEDFINDYMHMDYTENLGYCSDQEHHYYQSAKQAFNALNSHQRSLFTSNEAYKAEWDRLSTWASFNNEELSSNNILEANVVNIPSDNNSNILLIVVMSITVTLSLISITSIIIIKKKRVR